VTGAGSVVALRRYPVKAASGSGNDRSDAKYHEHCSARAVDPGPELRELSQTPRRSP
jgi:hypothetical protein